MECPSEEQIDEIEALKAIYEEYFIDISSKPICFIIKVVPTAVSLKAPLSLKVTLPQEYPDVAPILNIPNRSQILSQKTIDSLSNHLENEAVQNIGEAMVFTLVESMKEWLEEHDLEPAEEASESSKKEEESPESVELPLEKVKLEEPKVTGGRWDLVLGLVGKPSAGKSTFFNAATSLEMAKTGAHPFTTIEPNIGKAFFSIPCPCSRLDSLKQCDAAYGHNVHGERLVPCLLKDVAGLVPGACEGKGRGNRFLNDLCDADVLLHIVDVSGLTNENGEATTGYDPFHDVTWLQHEIHQWIYDNVKNKWEGIMRQPNKLIDMFTGYHSSRATIYQVLQAAGIGDLELAAISSWEDKVLHRIVAQFVCTRFPTYLVLNKADTEQAAGNILKVRQAFPDIPCLPVSARAEMELQQYVRQGVIEYSSGAQNWQTASNYNSSLDAANLDSIQQNVFNRYKSTNVARALSEAVALKHPVYSFPVQDLSSLTSIEKYKGEVPGSIRDAVALKPATTCEELYTAMLHYPLQLCAGDFIRAEYLTENGKTRIMRKTDKLGDMNSQRQVIVKIMTNRKVTPIKRR